MKVQPRHLPASVGSGPGSVPPGSHRNPQSPLSASVFCLPFLDALGSLNRRIYAGWEATEIEWEGPTLPSMFRSLFTRHLAARDPEERMTDPEWHRESFLFHYLLGIHYGYPKCCVLQFSCEATTVRPLGERRLGFVDYVPCDSCMERYLVDYHRDDDGGDLVPHQMVEP